MTKKEEQEIRRQRRALRRAERDRRRAERRARKEKHERIVNSPPINLKPQEPTYADLRNYHPLYFCGACRSIVRANLMFNEEICLDCHKTKRPIQKFETTHPEPLPDEDTIATGYQGELFHGTEEKADEDP